MSHRGTLRLEQRSRKAFLLLGLIPVVLVATVVWSFAQFRSEAGRVELGQRTLTAISNLISSVAEAESSVRAYFITGDGSYLQEFQNKRNEVARHAEDLRTLAAGNRLPGERTEELTDAAKERVDFLGHVARLHEAGQSVDAISREYGPHGERLIAAVRSVIETTRSEQERHLTERNKARSRMEILVFSLCGATILVSLVVAVGGHRSISQYRALRDRAEAELHSANADLERHIAARTSELQRAVSELRKTESELMEASHALLRSNADLESFAYLASHELQEPLRTIKIYLELLNRKYGAKLDGPAETFISTAIDGADRLELLVRGLLEYARFGASEHKHERVGMDAVLKHTLEDLRPAIQESGATVTYEALPIVEGDPASLGLLLRNLISNALKFRKPEEPPRVHISARFERDEWILSIRDNGIGFDPAYAARIFEMFTRLHRKADVSGNGMGLALVARIAKIHGGRAWAESQSGAGSTFFVSLPAAIVFSNPNEETAQA